MPYTHGIAHNTGEKAKLTGQYVDFLSMQRISCLDI